MRDHPQEVEERDEESRREYAETEQPMASSDRVPDPEAADREGKLLLRREGEQRDDRERDESVLVEEPDRIEDERHRERDRVEAVADREGVELRRGIEEIGKRELCARARRVEVLAREPEDRKRAAGHRERLQHEQDRRARRDPDQRRQQDEERVDVGAEPAVLVPVQRRVLEDVPVRRVPDRLHHVPEVEPRLLEHGIVKDGCEGEQHRVRGHPRIDDSPRRCGFAGL